MKNEKNGDTIKKKLLISSENKEIKLSYLNNILSKIQNLKYIQKCILQKNLNEENFLIIENNTKTLEELINENKKIGKSLKEKELLYIIYIFVELGAILDDNFCYNQEICVNSIKIYLDNISKLKIKLLHPFTNDKFRNEFISDFLEIFPNIPKNQKFEYNLFKLIERKKFLKCDKNDEVLKTLSKLDQYIYIKSKNCFYQLFFMIMCLAAGMNENEFKLDEKLFYEKIKETIENLNIKKESKDFFRFVLVRKNFDNLISFAELKNYLDIQLNGNNHDFQNDQFYQKYINFFQNINNIRTQNFEFETDPKIKQNLFPEFKINKESRKVLRISLDHKNKKSSSLNSRNQKNEYNFYNPKENNLNLNNENNGYGEIKTKIENLAYKIKKYRESIKNSENDIEENLKSNYEGSNIYKNNNKGKRIIRKSAVYCDVNLSKKFQKDQDNLIKNKKKPSISSSKKVRYLTVERKENKNHHLKRSNMSNISKRSLSQKNRETQLSNTQSKVVSSRVIYVKTDYQDLRRSNKKRNINIYNNNRNEYFPKKSLYKEEVRITPSLTPVKNMRRSFSQSNFNFRDRFGYDNNRLNKKENKNTETVLNLMNRITKKRLSSSRYDFNKENFYQEKKKKLDFEKLNSSLRSFKNININNFSKNEFNYSKLYEKLCPKKRNKSLDGSCFSFHNSYLNLKRSSYLKKGSVRNMYKNLNYKEKMNEYNF